MGPGHSPTPWGFCVFCEGQGGLWLDCGLCSWNMWVQISTIASCVTLDKLPNLSGIIFFLQNGSRNRPCPHRVAGRLQRLST